MFIWISGNLVEWEFVWRNGLVIVELDVYLMLGGVDGWGEGVVIVCFDFVGGGVGIVVNLEVVVGIVRVVFYVEGGEGYRDNFFRGGDDFLGIVDFVGVGGVCLCGVG